MKRLLITLAFAIALPAAAQDLLVRNATVHSPLALPKKPWDKLSDHAPLAAEILL